ncbi:Anthranilate synthase component 2 [Candidatus Bilamarchaeum dharawalense]|uniref:anthranilate synthase n=1 Tax=Candidatus Bilamarchaeum dharawalense TaxID=2885759 RepID=A0A5E4LPI0_9ARCH|nr:Anthranilate synthase component 2 [Candidatus Bilamarchaeum dharawalense]
MIVIIDNYDSFVYNLSQYVSELESRVSVYRNDQITINKITELKPKAIILSPGPGHPANRRDFGVCADILDRLTETKILGVCLGHQGIIHYFGGEVSKNKPMHGKTSIIEHNGTGIFKNVEKKLQVMRYHSLAGTKIPDCLEVTARSLDDNTVMAVQHRTLPIYGVQFHPESIMTHDGKKILQNFLELAP